MNVRHLVPSVILRLLASWTIRFSSSLGCPPLAEWQHAGRYLVLPLFAAASAASCFRAPDRMPANPWFPS